MKSPFKNVVMGHKYSGYSKPISENEDDSFEDNFEEK